LLVQTPSATVAGGAPLSPGVPLKLEARIAELAARRAQWRPDPVSTETRRLHAAWANAGIEGNPLSWRRTRELFSTAPSSREEPAILELRGCLAALEFVDEGLPLPWQPALLRHLHELLMAGLGRERGCFRSHEVEIVRESGPERGQTVFKPPHVLQVPELLEELLLSLDPDADPFLQAGRFHYEFQSIHPFSDGNGRLGRLLSTALARQGWMGGGFYLAPAVKRAGAAYYLALRAVRPDYQSEPRDGLRPWLLPFFDMLEDALGDPEPPKD
jgi:Fic family protein